MIAIQLWVSDLRWAANMRRVRRLSRNMPFDRRMAFFRELTLGPGTHIDRLMNITVDDICRALIASVEARKND